MLDGWLVLGDWGSTRLRLWCIRDGSVRDRLTGPGIVGLKGSPQDALRECLAPWRDRGLPNRITLAGMAGARGGLHEAPYAECPVTAGGWRSAMARLTLDTIPVRIAAGCADGTEDIMRGEETQIFGALTLRPALAHGSHLVVLPGTHCKWAWLEDGAIVRIRTVPTGELFALLRGSSLLTFRGNAPAVHDEDGFASGIAEARSSPGVLAKLFTARVAQLRSGRSPDWAASYLSGLLVAGEVAEMSAAYGMPARMTIVGEARLAALYGSVFDEFDIPNDTLDGDACVLSGLRLLDEND